MKRTTQIKHIRQTRLESTMSYIPSQHKELKINKSYYESFTLLLAATGRARVRSDNISPPKVTSSSDDQTEILTKNLNQTLKNLAPLPFEVFLVVI